MAGSWKHMINPGDKRVQEKSCNIFKALCGDANNTYALIMCSMDNISEVIDTAFSIRVL